MRNRVSWLLIALFMTSCMNREVVYLIPDTSIRVKVINGGQWARPYHNATIICVEDSMDTINYPDTIMAWKGVDWDWPLVFIINPSCLDTVLYEAPIGANTLLHKRCFYQIYRYAPILDDSFVNEEQLSRKDTLFFSENSDGSLKINDPFIALHFNTKFDALYYEKSEYSGKKYRLISISSNRSKHTARNQKRLYPMDLISEIEKYQQKYQRLPYNLEELAIDNYLNLGLNYEKNDSSSFIVYYNLGFGDRYVYCSDYKKWILEHADGHNSSQ